MDSRDTAEHSPSLGSQEDSPALNIDGRRRIRPSAAPDPEAVICLLKVFDDEGRGIPHTWALDGESVARSLTRDHPDVLACGDNAGSMRFPLDSLGSAFAIVGAVGHSSRRVEKGALEDGFETVVLSSSSKALVRCVDINGDPVEGAAVSVSRVALPLWSRPEVRVSIPGPDPLTAIYWAETDSEGTTHLSGLTPGDYDIQVDAPGLAIINRKPLEGLRIPGDSIRLVLAPLLAAVYVVEGTEVIAENLILHGIEISGFGQGEVERVRRSLEKRHPRATVVVGAQIASNHDPIARLRLLTASRGVQEVDLPMVPIDSIQSPEVLRIPKGEQGLEEAGFAVIDALGREQAMPDFYVSLGGSSIEAISVPLNPGGTVRLPAGEYDLKAQNPWLGSYSPRHLTVPGDNVVQLETVYRPCRILVRDRAGRACDRFVVTIDANGIRKVIAHRTTRPFERWLPVGVIDLTVEVLGYEPTETYLMVEHADRPSVQEIEVEVGTH